jgi:hypothetical protein
MSTKNTILKQYDGRFLQIFQEIYEQVNCPEFCLKFALRALLVCCGSGCSLHATSRVRICTASIVPAQCRAEVRVKVQGARHLVRAPAY